MMEASATIPRHHQGMPLASCEARARLALERGQLSRAAYQSLMGLTAEVLLARGTKESSEEEAAARRKRVTPCDTPPLRRGDEEEGPPPSGDKLRLPENIVAFDDELSEKYESGFVSPPPSPSPSPCSFEDVHEGANSDQSLLDKMQEQGLDLSSRATRFWNREEGNGDDPSTGSSKEEHDERFLRFVDVCLKTYPPPNPCETDDTPEFSRDIVWQNRLGLIVSKPPIEERTPIEPKTRAESKTRIESENARWDAKFDDMLRFKSARGHCDVPFRYGPNRSLGGWVQKQRDLNKRGKLPRGRFERLDDVGFSWVLSNRRLPKINDDGIHSYEDLWEFRFKCLAEYEAKHGHCNVPYRYARDVQLGRWVQNQREFRKRGTLSGERHRRLVELGFSWSLRKGGKQKAIDGPRDVESI